MDADVVIVGGGLSGPLTALALAQAGLRCVVVDAADPPARGRDFDGRAYALALSSVRMLQALDLWDRVADPCPITGIKASDGRVGEGASPLHLSFRAEAIDAPFMGQMVEDRHLRRALLDACDAADRIEMRFGQTVLDQDLSGAATVTLAGGDTLVGRLLVGCDGRGSDVAARAGLRVVRKDYGQTALTCAVKHDRPHGGIAHQLFLPAGPLAILPLTGDRSSLVWTEDAETAAAVQALDDAAYLDVLRPRFGSFLGDIALTGGRGTYPLSLNLAADLTAERVALVGDAGHGIHPIAGQGLNLGFKDAAALAQVLRDARRRGQDIGRADVLAGYARWRRFDAAQMGAATDAVNRLFSNDDPVLRLARRLGMGAVDAMPGLKRRFVREAAGLTGDLPDLMQGRRLTIN
ncbi:FAD-dependent oxidoreductase [Jannaschia sp. LMIT008]|uniref:FAD-dependent oxidoreductase n=1 Tax=Jannaschia maritima TaxID=3032585 RepID=UPI002810E49F|nr:FAD-dependent oxidoreductase [Jannaschia sp. LMIT008]